MVLLVQTSLLGTMGYFAVVRASGLRGAVGLYAWACSPVHAADVCVIYCAAFAGKRRVLAKVGMVAQQNGIHLLRLLASGSYGTVYLAKTVLGGMTVAVKVLEMQATYQDRLDSVSKLCMQRRARCAPPQQPPPHSPVAEPSALWVAGDAGVRTHAAHGPPQPGPSAEVLLGRGAD